MNTATIKKLTEIVEIADKFDFKLTIKRHDSHFLKKYLWGKSPQFYISIDVDESKHSSVQRIICSEADSLDVAVNKLHKNLSSTLKELEYVI